MSSFINYSELSRRLYNNRTSIDKKRIPKKLEKWHSELKEMIENKIKELE